MPFDISGSHWGDDIVFDQSTGEMDVDTGFTRSTKLLAEDIIAQTLVAKCGYTRRAILLFGFGQGGMAALSVARAEGEELSGVVSVGGGLSQGKVVEVGSAKCRTPVLVCKGNERSAVRDEEEDLLKAVFGFVQVKEWNRPGDGMPRNRAEMMPLMEFFARRLRSTKGVPKGSIELA
jgi:predicted esterase